MTWLIYCVTESKFIESVTLPTNCPNSAFHTVNSGSVIEVSLNSGATGPTGTSLPSGIVSNVKYGTATGLTSTNFSTSVSGSSAYSSSFASTPALSISSSTGSVEITSSTASGFTYNVNSYDSLEPQNITKIVQNVFHSTQVVNGNPAISYGGTGLTYIRANDETGSSWSNPVTIDNSTFIGDNYMTTVNGNPAVAYTNQATTDLKYVRALDATGYSWGSSIDVDASASNLGRYPTLKMVNNNPAISYYDSINKDVKYIRSLDSTGNIWSYRETDSQSTGNWDTPVSAATGTAVRYPSVNIVKGYPAIMYGDVTTFKYTRSSNENGTSNWSTPVNVITGANNASFSQLEIVNGYPAASFYYNALRYAIANDDTGSSWNPSIQIDTGAVLPSGINIQPTSIKVVNGNPAIAYATNSGVKYVRSNDSTGSSWGTPYIINTTSTVDYVNMEIVNNNPAITFYDGTNLLYYRSPITDGNTGTWISSQIATGGQYPCLKVVGGNPAIGYYDSQNLDLRYIRSSDSTGSSWNSSILLDSTGSVGSLCKLQVIDSDPSYLKKVGIVYLDQTNSRLKYILSSDETGVNWYNPITIGTVAVSKIPTMTYSNNAPLISYLNDGGFIELLTIKNSINTWKNTDLASNFLPNSTSHYSINFINNSPVVMFNYSNIWYYAVCNSSLDFFNTIQTNLPSTSITNNKTELQVTSANTPILLFQSGTQTNTLSIYKSNNSTGTSWTNTGKNINFYGWSSKVINDRIAITYASNADTKLYFAISNDATASSFATDVLTDPTLIMNTNYLFSGAVSLDSNAGIPAYTVVGGNYAINYLKANDSTGSSWKTPIVFGTGSISSGYVCSLSLKHINGYPMVAAYYTTPSGANYNTVFYKALNTEGTAWSSGVVLDTCTASLGYNVADNSYLSLTDFNGVPSISYINHPYFKNIVSKNTDGSSWNSPDIIYNTSTTGYYHIDSKKYNDKLINILNRNPDTFPRLETKFVYSSLTPNKTTYNPPKTIDTTGDVGQYTSMEVINGKPAIAYYDATNLDLKYVRSSDDTGGVWGAPITLDATGSVGVNDYLRVVNGVPSIAYYESINRNIKYIRANDSTGSTWQPPLIVETGDIPNSVLGTSMTFNVVNNKPAILYNNLAGNMRYIEALDSSGSAWDTSKNIDYIKSDGSMNITELTNNKPALTYYNTDKGRINYIHKPSLPINPTVKYIAQT